MSNKKITFSNLYPTPYTLTAKYTDFSNKDESVRQYVGYMLARTKSMFEYDGLPETIPARNLEILLQNNGYAIITEVNGKLYALHGGIGGTLNAYYEPTFAIVANPYLRFERNIKLVNNINGQDLPLVPEMAQNSQDGIYFRNDSLSLGLLPLFSRYASMLAENDVSIRLADINARIISLITAPTDEAKKAAELYLQDIISGKMGIVQDSAIIEGIKAQPLANTGNANNITQLIELHQYLKAGWYNDIGLNANYNMKRESINSDEAQMNEDSLLPFIDDMLNMRKEAVEEINKMYGTNISVRRSGAWKLVEEKQSAEADTETETETETEEKEVEENE